jgi:glycosyltransferase involved in cell wall biosynthesis
VVVAYAKLYHKKVVFCGADDTDFDPEKVQLPIYRDKMLYFWGMKRCDEIVVQNETQQKLLSENFKRKGRLIHNGFHKTNHDSVEKKEILWVAKIRKKKNPQLFVELAKKFPNEKFVMIGGRGSRNSFNQQDLYEHISEEAKEITNLEFKGFLPFEETEKQFMSAKLFINTSAHEGFPNTFLQAWSRGIPVISFVDPDDLIYKNQLGSVVNNFEEMVQTLREVLNNRIQFSSSQIKVFFEKNLTIEKTVDKYENLFYHLLNGQITSNL